MQMTSEQYYALLGAIENLFDIATLKPINWTDLVVQNARNIRTIVRTVKPCATTNAKLITTT
jgi:hypothetical protein